MSFEDETRTLALLVLDQYLARRLSKMQVTRETLQGIWPLDRWHQTRLATIEGSLRRYFPKVTREWYRGRHGDPGFRAFLVFGIDNVRHRKRSSKASTFRVFIPNSNDELFGGYGVGDNVPDFRIGSWSSAQILEYNLHLLKSVATPWVRKRGTRT